MVAAVQRALSQLSGRAKREAERQAAQDLVAADLVLDQTKWLPGEKDLAITLPNTEANNGALESVKAILEVFGSALRPILGNNLLIVSDVHENDDTISLSADRKLIEIYRQMSADALSNGLEAGQRVLNGNRQVSQGVA